MEAGLSTLGDRRLLDLPLWGLFCSRRCPGALILQAHELAQKISDARLPTIGGFHAPVEQEMFTVLLRGSQPVVIVLGRRLEGARLPPAWNKPIEAGRLLVVSPFGPDGPSRVTAASGQQRNILVAHLAQQVLVVHAEPDGQLYRQARLFLDMGKSLYTMKHEANNALVEIGAKIITPSIAPSPHIRANPP